MEQNIEHLTSLSFFQFLQFGLRMFTPPKVVKQPMLVNSSDDIVKKAPQCGR